MKAVRLPSGNYRCQVRVNGKMYSVTRPTAAQARHDATAMQINGVADLKDPYGGMTLRQACEKYIDLHREVNSQSTIRGYSQYVENRLQGIIDVPLSAINDDMLQEAVNLDLRRLSVKTVTNTVSFFSTVISWKTGRRPKIVLPQDAKTAEIDEEGNIKDIEDEMVILDMDDYDRFLRVIYGKKHEIAFLLGLHGLRASEILALEKNYISGGVIHVRGAAVLDENNILVRKKENKNITSRRDVPVLIPRLQELVDAAPDGVLVPVNCGQRLSESLKGICIHNGFPPLTMHKLRYSFASMCYSLNIPVKQFMALGGWSDINVAMRIYTHLQRRDRRESVDKLKEFFRDMA